MAPRTANKKIKKEQIIKAALSIFAEKGLRSTTVAEIADKVDIGKGTIYLYFCSKEEIYCE